MNLKLLKRALPLPQTNIPGSILMNPPRVLLLNPEFLNREKFEEMKRIVLMKVPKVHSTAIEEMRREVEEIAKELEK